MIDPDEVIEAVQESISGVSYPGFCIACGEYHDGIEPDARNCTCDACGKAEVFGAEEILLMGLV